MKNLQNLGKALSKAEQKTINGGDPMMDVEPWYNGFNPCGTLCFVQGGCRLC